MQGQTGDLFEKGPGIHQAKAFPIEEAEQFIFHQGAADVTAKLVLVHSRLALVIEGSQGGICQWVSLAKELQFPSIVVESTSAIS